MITVIIPLAPKKEIENAESLKKQKNIKVLIERGKNPSENRNNGVKKAKTDFIAFINGHTIVADGWAKKAEEFFSKHPEIDIVGGPQLNPENENLLAKASGYALGSFFGAGMLSRRYRQDKLNLNADENSLTSANLICRKKVFRKVLFNEKIYPGEDPTFISDAKKAGFKIAYSPDIIVYNKRRSSLRALAKQIYNYGKTRIKKEKFGIVKKPVFLIPSLFVIYLITLLFIADKILLIPLLIYLILNLSFSIAESIRQKNVLAAFILPVIFLTIHISYGIGFLAGIIVK